MRKFCPTCERRLYNGFCQVHGAVATNKSLGSAQGLEAFDTGTDLTGVESDIATLQADLNTAEGEIDTPQADVTALEIVAQVRVTRTTTQAVDTATDELSGSVEFKIGGVSYGSAAVVPVPDVADGSVQATILVDHVTQMPGTYTIAATFTSTNPNFTGSDATATLTVVARDADPYEAAGFYTGDLLAWTTGPNSSTATVALSAMIKDNNQPAGDLRGAKVTFYVVNGTKLIPISSATNLPVVLVDVTDGTVGTASAIVQLNIGSLNAQSFQIAVGISGGYVNDPWDALSQTIVTVAKPLTGGFIAGGGRLRNTASAGLLKGATGQPTCFQLDVRYNKSGANPQGKAKIMIRSLYNASGILDRSGDNYHIYIVTSNAIALLSATPPTAMFTSKVNVAEQLPDGSLVGLEGGAMLQLSMTDGSPDKLAITVQRKAGGLWFASNWSAAAGRALEQPVDRGGLRVQ